MTISLEKTGIMSQDVSNTPSISISDLTPEVVEDLTYLGSTISGNLCLGVDLNDRQRSYGHGQPDNGVWDNLMLTINTKVRVYQALLCSIPVKSAGSTAFICATSVDFWVSRYKIVYQTRMFSIRQASPAC